MYNSNTNCSLLKEILNFMINQGLVQEKSIGKDRLAYKITQRGLSILNAFQELNKILPIIEKKSDQVSAFV